jgi:hypothetical protein
MPNPLQIAGAQSDKNTRFAAIYTGRFFSGLWTNRSPLRDAASSRTEEKYYGPRGDAMIAGSNVEITNKQTVSRRPGNPIYSQFNSAVGPTTPWNNILSFDEFRLNKGLSDVFGTVTEQIDVMVDTSTALYALNGSSSQLVFTKTAGAGQDYMKQVGNELYFGNGINDKKWLQSLFVRTSASNSATLQLNSYPFMDTFLIDPNGNIQQIIGAIVQSGAASSVNNITVTNVVIANNVATFTTSASPFVDQPIGTQFMFWGFTNPNTKFLNGFTVTLTSDWSTISTSFTANIIHPNVSQADTAFIQIESGGTDSVHNTLVLGSSVPTWGTTVPSSSNNFYGSLTIDGQAIWINRGNPVENWGLAAPTQPLTVTASGTSQGWMPKTYYSPASIYIDNNAGFLWQVTTAGTTGAVQPSWPGSPTPSAKTDILSVSLTSNVVTFKTATQAYSAGNIVNIAGLLGATFLNGQALTVISTGLSTTQFEANFTHANYPTTADNGYSSLPGTTQADNTVTWTCIQSPASLTWATHNHYYTNDYLTAIAGGVNYFYQLSKRTQPFISGWSKPTISQAGFASPNNGVSAYAWTGNPSTAGSFDKFYGEAGLGASSTLMTTPGSLFAISSPTIPSNTGVPATTQGAAGDGLFFFSVNGAGELNTTGSINSFGGFQEWEAAFICNIFIPTPGPYSFSASHDDGTFFAFDNSAGVTRNSGTTLDVPANPPAVPQTAVLGTGTGYLNPVGQNASGFFPTDSGSYSFPTVGNYGLEIDWKNWENQSKMVFTCNGQNLAISPDESGSSTPAFPPFTTTGATYNATLGLIVYGSGDTVQEAANQYTWSNIGPVSDFTWTANTPYTLPATVIIDSNSNQEGPIQTGISGTTAPVWQTALNAITIDNAVDNLKWINEGNIPTQTTTGKITATSAQGWEYAIALVNTLDNTVSNIGPLSKGTGPVVNGQVTFAPGAGLTTAIIDPQADYVAIFRTTDGLTTLLLDPSNGNTNYTVPLVTYLQYGFVDNTPDTGLDTLITAAANGENTPPLPGAVNLTYHLNRIWYSIGNIVYYTTGPLATVGNGINGTAPLNFDVQEAMVTRLVPTAIGLLVFTVSDIRIIANNGNGTILPSLPYEPGIGLSNYNALDQSGPMVGFFTTDRQFLLFNPSAGVQVMSSPIGDQLRKNTNVAPTAFNPKTAYVAWYVNGEDMGWFLADGANGWFRLINNPAPDFGMSWSPFSTIVGGVKAIKSVEVAPGIHNLLTGPTGSGSILYRNLDASTDGGLGLASGNNYPAFMVFGSYVLAQPGQVAQIMFITTDSVAVGSPLILGLLIDEALPYFTGSFEILKDWTNDPPGLPPSKSIYGQRFYLSETQEPAACRHAQIMVQWPPENAINELQSFTIYGSFVQES